MSTDPHVDPSEPSSAEDQQADPPTARTGMTNPSGYWGGISYAERDEIIAAKTKGHGKGGGGRKPRRNR